MAEQSPPATEVASRSARPRHRRWLLASALGLVIVMSVWRLLFFNLWDSDEFKPPPSWNGTPAFVATAFTEHAPPPNAGLGLRLTYALENFRRKHSGKGSRVRTYVFPTHTNALHATSALLTTCMEIVGTRYLIAREVEYVEFGHTNTLAGTQWVSAVEKTLQSNLVQCYHPSSNGLWSEKLLLVREKSGVVKVLPPSRLADYQKAGLVDASYKPPTIAPTPEPSP
jgi:hypothetical protein